MDAAWGGPSGFKMKSIRKIITVLETKSPVNFVNIFNDNAW
jgi:hypothetical protein